MSGNPENPIQTKGFGGIGIFSLVLVVVKLTVAGHWSWWRVMLPALAFLGNNALYMLVGFLCLFWLKYAEEENEAALVRKQIPVYATTATSERRPNAVTRS